MPNQEAEWARELQQTRRSARITSSSDRQSQINDALSYYLNKLARGLADKNTAVITETTDKILALKAEEVVLAVQKDIDLYGEPQPETYELVVEPYGEFAAALLYDTNQSNT